MEPYRDLSHLASGIRERKGKVELFFATRVVVEPHSARRVDFVAFAFAPRWAWREAVQVYHDAFPDFARPTPGVDPRLTGIDGYVFASRDTRTLQMEECRRFQIGWEWVYGPFQTPGDWYPEESLWDPHKGYGGTSDLHHNEVPGTLEDYQRATRDRFHLRQAQPSAHCWSLTGGPESLRPPILESQFVVSPVRDVAENGPDGPDNQPPSLILVGPPAAFGLEKVVSVPARGGIVRFVDWRGHRALWVAGADDRLTEAAVLRLLQLFDLRYPFWGALPEGGFYQRAGLSGRVLGPVEEVRGE